MGKETDCVRWRSAADALKSQIHKQLVQDGYYVGERQPTRRFPMRADYLLDIANLGLAVPFRVVAPDSPEMVRTVELLEAEVDYPIGGVGRYRSDLFMGGNPWSLSALWLGLYFVETGQVDEVYRQLNWCLKHAMLHDFMPEQSHRETSAPAGASPLAWSHAWLIILLQRLGDLVRNSPDAWPTVEKLEAVPATPAASKRSRRDS
jgi:GH15 family glucan-1,4-alpha-glucosidase